MEQNGRDVSAFDTSRFCRNNICTTNYRWWNFIPKNLFKQFHRAANWFFLLMIALNWTPQLNAIGKHFSITPLLMVLMTDAVKDLYEDIRRGRQDDTINERDCYVYNKKNNSYSQKKWKNIHVGDVIRILCKHEMPADILIVDTSDEFGFAYADTSTLDGETNLKQKVMPKIPDFESMGIRNLTLDVKVEAPNNDLTKLDGYIITKDEKIPLNLNNFILRGSQLRNTDYIVGLVVYAGHDTKAMQNNKGYRAKRSKIERIMNGFIFIIFALLIILCTTSAIGHWLWLEEYGNRDAPYLLTVKGNKGYLAFLSFWTFIIIYNQVIPMSLYILLEITKLLQNWLLRQDLELFGRNAIMCRSMSITEDLGQVEYIFSDKTGTLTENKMIFKCMSCKGKVYGIAEVTDSPNLFTDESGEVRPEVDRRLVDAIKTDEMCKNFLVSMAVCNTVMVTTEGRRGISFSQYLPRDFNRIVYEAESPDELSLVNAAREYGFILLRRTPESCVVRQQSVIMRYKVLAVLPFDSSRKCMSIIVIHPRTMQTVLLSKGADSVIMARLKTQCTKEESEIRNKTLENINSFACKGLRTLAFGQRVLDAAEYNTWSTQFKNACSLMEGREEAVSLCCSSIEQNLSLIGATGVEDKLQEGVPQVLSSFRRAGIVVWVLTGDKQETAVSIGYSSQLYTRDTTLQFINNSTLEGTRSTLLQLLEHTPTGQMHKQALIINGCSAPFLLSKELRAHFLALCQTCQTVICCRVTPLQKAQIVSMMREELGVMTLAIGDGANDVSMLRQADVGIGIAGREGTQAVMASDFAIEQFQMLQKLLLVHGHWTYYRISDFIYFFLYKNVFYCSLTFFFQFFNGFSGSFPQEEFYLITFNTFWTTPATFVAFILNQYGSARTLKNNPQLYTAGRRDEFFNKTNFYLHMLEAIYHALIVFSVNSLTYWDTPTGKLEFGCNLNFIAITIMNLSFFVRSPNISVLLGFAVFFSILALFLWSYLYGMATFLYKIFQEDPYYTFAQSVTNPIMWLNFGLCVVLAFLPRICIDAVTKLHPEVKKSPEQLKAFCSSGKKLIGGFVPVVWGDNVDRVVVEPYSGLKEGGNQKDKKCCA